MNPMKRTIMILAVLTVLFSVLSFSSCNQLDKLTQFDMSYESSVTIPSTAGVDLPFNLFTPDITTNSEQKFSVNNTKKDLIDEISLKSMELQITAPGDGTFSFLKSVDIYIKADGLSELKIAWKDNIDTSAGNLIQLDTSNDNLKDYILKDSFSLRVQTVTDELINQDYDIKVTSTFHVNAKILGV